MTSQARVSVRASDANEFIAMLRGLGVEVEDTGERVTTDESFDGELVLSVTVAPRLRSGTTMSRRH